MPPNNFRVMIAVKILIPMHAFKNRMVHAVKVSTARVILTGKSFRAVRNSNYNTEYY